MTRKDYRRIAEALKITRQVLLDSAPESEHLSIRVTLDATSAGLAEALVLDNERFDVIRFYEAAGVGT